MPSIDMRSLSTVEIELVAGGLQYNDNPQNYVMQLVVMPDPAFVIAPAKPAADQTT